jgi:aminoglycoside 6-adenylyltransferase
MTDLIMNVAKQDERIRAVLLVGSRANPNVPKDIYQDYDVTFFVKDVTPFRKNLEWIDANFGKPALMQMPDDMTLLPHNDDGCFTYLMLFEDGNRIDLSFKSQFADDNEPAIALLDKDGLLNISPAYSDSYWHIKPPTEKHFADCCNEFWWCLGNVGKGIARDELPYAMKMLNDYVRDMLNRMLEWYIGANTGYSVSVGKFGKYFKKYLPEEFHEMYLKTYSTTDYDQVWSSVFTACYLFHEAALRVSAQNGFSYNRCEEEAMTAYLKRVQGQMHQRKKE